MLTFLLLLHRNVHSINTAKTVKSKKVSVFGASGGLGQWCCKLLFDKGYDVSAITRDKLSLLSKLNETPNDFGLLRGCKIIQADARVVDDALAASVRGAEHVIISVGTTAFPSKKWEGGNTPTVVGPCVTNLFLAMLIRLL